MTWMPSYQPRAKPGRSDESSMGGYGSGWQRGKKTTVEDCLVLSAGKLQRDKLLQHGLHASGWLTWTNTVTGEETSSISYEVDTIDPAPWLRLYYTLTRIGEAVDYRVYLTTTALPWGEDRWAFLCPNVSCGRACRKLYLPPGCRYFTCRLCYRLTYESSQEAHKFDDMYFRLGCTPGQWKRLLEWERKHGQA